MTNTLVCVIFLCVLVAQISCIDWRDSGAVTWALDCDFTMGDFAHVRSSGQDCGGICERNDRCDSFTWSNYEGGTCWMKSGLNPLQLQSMSTSDAARGMVCGFIGRKMAKWEHPQKVFGR